MAEQRTSKRELYEKFNKFFNIYNYFFFFLSAITTIIVVLLAQYNILTTSTGIKILLWIVGTSFSVWYICLFIEAELYTSFVIEEHQKEWEKWKNNLKEKNSGCLKGNNHEKNGVDLGV